MSLGQMFASGLSAVWGGGTMFLMVVLAIILGNSSTVSMPVFKGVADGFGMVQVPIAALLLVLGGILISHFTGRSNETEATTAKVKTTAFERSVSNNASATETTTEEDISVQYDENGEISESTASTASASSSTSRRTSTRTTTRTTTASTTRSTTRSTTASTTQSTAPATQTPSTAVPSTDPVTQPPTQAPSPWDHVNN